MGSTTIAAENDLNFQNVKRKIKKTNRPKRP